MPEEQPCQLVARQITGSRCAILPRTPFWLLNAQDADVPEVGQSVGDRAILPEADQAPALRWHPTLQNKPSGVCLQPEKPETVAQLLLQFENLGQGRQALIFVKAHLAVVRTPDDASQVISRIIGLSFDNETDQSLLSQLLLDLDDMIDEAEVGSQTQQMSKSEINQAHQTLIAEPLPDDLLEADRAQLAEGHDPIRFKSVKEWADRLASGRTFQTNYPSDPKGASMLPEKDRPSGYTELLQDFEDLKALGQASQALEHLHRHLNLVPLGEIPELRNKVRDLGSEPGALFWLTQVLKALSDREKQAVVESDNAQTIVVEVKAGRTDTDQMASAKPRGQIRRRLLGSTGPAPTPEQIEASIKLDEREGLLVIREGELESARNKLAHDRQAFDRRLAKEARVFTDQKAKDLSALRAQQNQIQIWADETRTALASERQAFEQQKTDFSLQLAALESKANILDSRQMALEKQAEELDRCQFRLEAEAEDREIQRASSYESRRAALDKQHQAKLLMLESQTSALEKELVRRRATLESESEQLKAELTAGFNARQEALTLAYQAREQELEVLFQQRFDRLEADYEASQTFMQNTAEYELNLQRSALEVSAKKKLSSSLKAQQRQLQRQAKQALLQQQQLQHQAGADAKKRVKLARKKARQITARAKSRTNLLPAWVIITMIVSLMFVMVFSMLKLS